MEDPPAFVEFTVVDSTAPETTFVSGPGATPGVTHPSPTAPVRLHLQRAGLDLRVRAGRGTVQLVRPARRGAEPRRRHLHLRGAGARPVRQPRPDPATRVHGRPAAGHDDPDRAGELTSTDSTATFTFEANQPATFECLVNTNGVSTPPVPCTSPFTYTAPAPGDYLFAVRATDTAGNRAPLYTLHEWTLGLGVSITGPRRPRRRTRRRASCSRRTTRARWCATSAPWTPPSSRSAPRRSSTRTCPRGSTPSSCRPCAPGCSVTRSR